MIKVNLSMTVFNWYNAKRAPRLFSKALDKYRPVSIHHIINLNAGKRTAELIGTGNTLTVIILRLKRGMTAREALSVDLTSIQHGNTSRRFLRRLNHASMRGSK